MPRNAIKLYDPPPLSDARPPSWLTYILTPPRLGQVQRIRGHLPISPFSSALCFSRSCSPLSRDSLSAFIAAEERRAQPLLLLLLLPPMQQRLSPRRLGLGSTRYSPR